MAVHTHPRSPIVDKTFFEQRPVVGPSSFNGNNTLIVPQDPDSGTFAGTRLPDWRNAFHDARASKVDLRGLCEDLLMDGARDLVAQKFPGWSNRSHRRSLLSQIRTGFKNLSDEGARDSAIALSQENILQPDRDALAKPAAEFFRRVMTGLIKPPAVNLAQYSGPEDGDKLQSAIRLAYRLSGLPRLSQAFGISDILANEGGTSGDYTPRDRTHVVPGIKYESRSSISVASRYAFNQTTQKALYVKHPFVPANMRCVSDIDSARAAIAAGLCPIISRTAHNANERIEAAEQFGIKAFITVRSSVEEQGIAEEILKKGGHICIEMANANMPKVVKMIRELKARYPESFIIVGNVGSAEGYWLAVEAGADMVKLGRGPGAGCTTPEETGISPGQTALMYECAMLQAYLLLFYGKDVPLCLDGGLSVAGHLVVGGMLGAETFMMGSKFAVAKESPARRLVDESGNVFIEYFGEASPLAALFDALTPEEREFALKKAGQGVVGTLPQGGTYEEIVSALAEGLRGGVADLGVISFGELAGSSKSLFARVKTAGTERETKTRVKKNTGNLKHSVAGRFTDPREEARGNSPTAA